MTHLKSLLAASVIGLSTLASVAQADNVDSVMTLYNLLDDAGSAEKGAAFMAAASSDWQSIGDYSGKNSSPKELVGRLGGFAKVIPDLDWNVEEIHEAGDVITVRSRATGTPVKPFFGVDGEGRSFDIMAIDVHHLKDGKLVKTYHVEDWAHAMQQLSGK